MQYNDIWDARPCERDSQGETVAAESGNPATGAEVPIWSEQVMKLRQAAESVPGKQANEAAVPKGSEQAMNRSQVEESVPGKQADGAVVPTGS